jgi:hypothetical protein
VLYSYRAPGLNDFTTRLEEGPEKLLRICNLHGSSWHVENSAEFPLSVHFWVFSATIGIEVCASGTLQFGYQFQI